MKTALSPALQKLFPAWLAATWQAEEWRYMPLAALEKEQPVADVIRTELHIEAGKKDLTPMVMQPIGTHHERIIHVGKGADVFLIDDMSAVAVHFFTMRTRVVVERNAKLSITRLHAPRATHIVQGDITVKEGASFAFNRVHVGTHITRQNIHVALEGLGAEAIIRSVNSVKGNGTSDMLVDMQHKAANTRSMQNIRSLAADKARAVFQGKIHVHKNAQKTDAVQNHHGLLLSDTAEIDAKPSLEIYADDVKCAHGATCGALDDAALFYLRSRGIGQDDAKHLLLKAFVSDLFDDGLGNAEIHAAIHRFIEERMSIS